MKPYFETVCKLPQFEMLQISTNTVFSVISVKNLFTTLMQLVWTKTLKASWLGNVTQN